LFLYIVYARSLQATEASRASKQVGQLKNYSSDPSRPRRAPFKQRFSQEFAFCQSGNFIKRASAFQSSPTGQQQYTCIRKFATADASHDCPASMHMFALHCIASLHTQVVL